MCNHIDCSESFEDEDEMRLHLIVMQHVLMLLTKVSDGTTIIIIIIIIITHLDTRRGIFIQVNNFF